MAPKENPDERFRHRRSSDPLSDQQPGIGKQPYRRGELDDRSSLGDDKTPSYENRKDDDER